MNLETALINEIIMICQNHTCIEKVILFGSRARGDNDPKSDIDLAIYGNGNLGLFTDDLQNNLHSLLELDITQIQDGLDAYFLQQIETEGITLYEKSSI